ncbi:MAG: hypothetical protein M1457_03030, partial [bacterium]|nr:hypothetical protein [bacterium]
MTLVDQIGGPDGDLLSVRRVLTGAAPGEGSADERRCLLAHYQGESALRQGLERRRAEGFKTVVAMGDARLFAALGRKGSSQVPLPAPVVPNMQGFMREAVEYGMVGAGLRRAWRVGPVALVGLGVRGVGRAPALARRDFPTMLECFVELELADFTRYDPPVVFLQAQMTDLALALRNPRIFEAYLRAVRGRTGALPGLATQNFGHLAAALKIWGLEVDAVLTPWEESGARLRPAAVGGGRAA